MAFAHHLTSIVHALSRASMLGDKVIDFPQTPRDVYIWLDPFYATSSSKPSLSQTTEKANETVKKTERCLFQLDLMQLQIKTRLKDLHKSSLECLLSINTFDEKRKNITQNV